MSMILLIGYIFAGGLVFGGAALVLGFLCMIYDRDSFGGHEIGIMIFIAGVCGLIAGGIFGIVVLCEIQEQARTAIPPLTTLARGTWV